jgi:pilus assembly protein CpaF
VDAAAVVEVEVRELVRCRGIDPFSDDIAVRRLVDDVIADYEDRSATGAMPLLLDPTSVARQVYDAVAGLGLLQPFLDDDEIEEIWINEPGRVFVARQGRSELTTALLDEAAVHDLVERMLKSSGRRIDLSPPFVDAMLADGSRLHVVIPDITRRHWSVNIRKFVVRAHSLDQLVGLGSLTIPSIDLP